MRPLRPTARDASPSRTTAPPVIGNWAEVGAVRQRTAPGFESPTDADLGLWDDSINPASVYPRGTVGTA